MKKKKKKIRSAESAEHADWVGDCLKRAYRKSDKYKEAGRLAERYRKKK